MNHKTVGFLKETKFDFKRHLGTALALGAIAPIISSNINAWRAISNEIQNIKKQPDKKKKTSHTRGAFFIP